MNSDRRHILYLLPYLERGGTERHVLSLMRQLGDRYWVTLLAPAGAGSAMFADLEIPYLQFVRLDQNIFQGISQLHQALQAIQRSRPIDLVHVHAAHELMFFVKLFLSGKIPTLFTVHGYHGDQSEFSYRAACWFTNRFAKAAIAVCEAEQKLLRQWGIQPAKLRLIYNGVAKAVVNKERSQELADKYKLDRQNQIIIGTAARLTVAKGLTYLIQAFAKLKSDHNLRLVIAGTGELEAELQQLSQDLNVADRVIFAGYVENLADLMELYTIFVLPSLQEACSLACAEAMAQKKAVIGTNVGGISEQILDGKTGFIIPPQDVSTLAAKLETLINDPNLVREFAENGSDRYQQYFTETTMIEQTKIMYESLFES